MNISSSVIIQSISCINISYYLNCTIYININIKHLAYIKFVRSSWRIIRCD